MHDEFKPAGGTEILASGLKKNLGGEFPEKINLILSNTSEDLIRYSKKNVLWQHLNTNDESLYNYSNNVYMKTIDAFVYVSNWQYEKYSYIHKIPNEKSYVIKNAIDPIEYVQRSPSEKIKMVYTSTPWRGLEQLLDIFEKLNRDDVELDIYSSTIIYGSGFQKYIGNSYDHIFDRAKNMKNVNYMGYLDNESLKKKLKDYHIFVYPSVFEETCCLSVIEAAAAGCRIVSTNLGALYETGSEYATLVPFQKDKRHFVNNFTETLNYEIDNYWTNKNQTVLKEQSDFYNKFYSWEKRIEEWKLLFQRIITE